MYDILKSTAIATAALASATSFAPADARVSPHYSPAASAPLKVLTGMCNGKLNNLSDAQQDYCKSGTRSQAIEGSFQEKPITDAIRKDLNRYAGITDRSHTSLEIWKIKGRNGTQGALTGNVTARFLTSSQATGAEIVLVFNPDTKEQPKHNSTPHFKIHSESPARRCAGLASAGLKLIGFDLGC